MDAETSSPGEPVDILLVEDSPGDEVKERAPPLNFSLKNPRRGVIFNSTARTDEHKTTAGDFTTHRHWYPPAW